MLSALVVVGSASNFVSCFTPLSAEGHGAGVRLTSGPRFSGPEVKRGYVFELPCGKCIGCRMDNGREWSIRIQQEAMLYDRSLFLTLTYDDSVLSHKDPPEYLKPSLDYRHVQLFMKRLRKKYRGLQPGPKGNFPLRFYVCGEYGPQNGRPHWHMILFNMLFKDQKRWQNGDYVSEDLDALWQNGNCTIGDLTPGRASYAAGYVNKKQAPTHTRYERMDWYTGELITVQPEFHRQSSRPGVGFWFYEKYVRDMFPNDMVVMDGRRWTPPDYYWDKFRELAPEPVTEEVLRGRRERARVRPRSESTPERRAVREEVAKAKLAHFDSREL